MDAEETAFSVAAELEPGQSRRIVCPVCHGGDDHSRTFVVIRDASKITYGCHRASCSAKWKVAGAGGMSRPRQLERTYDLRYMTEPLEDLSHDEQEWLTWWFELNSATVANAGIKIATGEGLYRFAVPIRNPVGYNRGWLLRACSSKWEDCPLSSHYIKAETFREHPTDPMVAWFSVDDFSSIVIVEDAFSAMKVQQSGKTAVALLTAPDQHRGRVSALAIQEIASRKADRVLLALDPDAQANAFRFAKNYSPAFKNLEVKLLTADPKDLPMNELKESLR